MNHVARDTARSCFWACLTRTSHIQALFSPFWAGSRKYCGFRGQQRALCHGAIKPHVKCGNGFPSFGRFDWVSRLFRPSKAGLGKMRNFGRPPPDLSSPPQGSTTSAHLVEPDSISARARWGPAVVPPGSPRQKESLFPKLFLNHPGCRKKCF